MKKTSLKLARSYFVIILAGISVLLGGCAHSGQLHPFAGQRGLLMPIGNPDAIVGNIKSLTLYLGDEYNRRQEGGQVIFGHRLEGRLREYMGSQVASVCRTLPCYIEAAKKWKRSFVLFASFQKDDDVPRPAGVFRLTRWSTDPAFPQTTVTVSFSLSAGQVSYEKILQEGIDKLIAQILFSRNKKSLSDLDEPDPLLRGLIAKGDIDRALQLGERLYSDPVKNHLTKDFYYTLYSLEESTGKPEMAKKIGTLAIDKDLASKSLLIKMAQNAKNRGERNEERTLLFKGISAYPNNQAFWQYLIRDYIQEGAYQKALTLVREFDTRNPPTPNRPNFPEERYAILVGMGKGEDADLWFRSNIKKTWTDSPEPSVFLAHAVVTRYFQQGEWKKASDTLNVLIGRGVKSETLYRDLMTALGAENNPIEEVRVGREAMARGMHSRWIKEQVAYLEQKGY